MSIAKHTSKSAGACRPQVEVHVADDVDVNGRFVLYDIDSDGLSVSEE